MLEIDRIVHGSPTAEDPFPDEEFLACAFSETLAKPTTVLEQRNRRVSFDQSTIEHLPMEMECEIRENKLESGACRNTGTRARTLRERAFDHVNRAGNLILRKKFRFWRSLRAKPFARAVVFLLGFWSLGPGAMRHFFLNLIGDL